MRIVRKLFVVPLAENDHGKSTIMNSLISQATGVAFAKAKKGLRQCISPWGRSIEAYLFRRSYQESEKNKAKTVEDCLRRNDRNWHSRELIVLPSHVEVNDTQEMIDAAHRGGFDAVCVPVILDDSDRRACAPVLAQLWDERWTVPNDRVDGNRAGQLDALGRDLWTWICQALASG